jgi:hypothetical protein
MLQYASSKTAAEPADNAVSLLGVCSQKLETAVLVYMYTTCVCGCVCTAAAAAASDSTAA